MGHVAARATGSPTSVRECIDAPASTSPGVQKRERQTDRETEREPETPSWKLWATWLLRPHGLWREELSAPGE